MTELTEQELETIFNAPVTPAADGEERPLIPGHFRGTSGFQYAMGFNPETQSYSIEQSVDTLFGALDRDDNGTIGSSDARESLSRVVNGLLSNNYVESAIEAAAQNFGINIDGQTILSAVDVVADAVLGIFAGDDNELTREEATAIAAQHDRDGNGQLDRAELRALMDYYRGEVQEAMAPMLTPIMDAIAGRGGGALSAP